MKGILLAITLCVSALSGIFAQNGTIRGFVYEEESGEAVIFTNVYLAGTSMGASTDVNGYFSITNIPEGTYTLEVKYLGYETLQKQIDVTGKRIITENLFLKKSSIQMQTVEISAEKEERQTNVTMSVTKATPKDIKIIPTIGGTADLAQYLQVVPGVIFTGDQGGQLYIRGGSPVQNKVLLDGMTIYNPFHSIGLFSVFDTELIRNADIYTGGFGAQYGGRISSVMDITMREGNKRRFAGKVGANTFGANVMLEGPIKRQTNEGNSSSSFVFSAKHSYLDQSSKMLYDYVDEDGLPFSFTDLYGKVSFNASTGSKFSLFGFNYTDATTFQKTSSLDWNSAGGGLNFVLVPDGSPVLVEGQFNISNYEITLIEQNTSRLDDVNDEPTFLRPRTSGINNYNFGINFKYFNGDNEFKYGVDINGFSTDLTFYTGIGELIQQEQNSTELAGYATYKFKVNNLILDLGFRAQYYSSLKAFKPEPRVGMKYNITRNFRLKAAGGLFSQNLISSTSDRDVVNLFYGFLVAPADIQDEFLKEDGTTREILNPLQTAYHLIVGAEYDLTDRISINVEGYYKNFNQVSNINRNKIYSSKDPSAPAILKNDFIIESGEARGVDFTFKYEDKKYYIWAVYSLGDVDRWDGVKSYNPVFDRRHNVNLLASRRFGKRLDWEVNARWNYGSGFPFTQNQGMYFREVLENDIITDITDSNTDQVEIQYAGLNQGKLPDYSRLDLTLKKTFEFSENSSLEASVSVTNAYNRDNIFYVDRITAERINQLPILPSFGFLYSF